MNERIRKIAEQAGAEFYKGFAGSPDSVKFMEEDFEKFAELIVREFRSIIKQVYLETAAEHRECLLVLDAKVEEHFGVHE